MLEYIKATDSKFKITYLLDKNTRGKISMASPYEVAKKLNPIGNNYGFIIINMQQGINWSKVKILWSQNRSKSNHYSKDLSKVSNLPSGSSK